MSCGGRLARALLLAMSATSGLAFGAEPARKPTSLSISISGLAMAKFGPFCEALGTALEVGKAPYGFGVFTSHQCRPAAAANATEGWTLAVAPSGAKVVMRLFFQGLSPQCRHVMSAIALPRRWLTDPPRRELIDSLALYLLDGLPFLGKPEALMAATRPPASGGASLPHPAALMAYDLSFDEETCTWIPSNLSEAGKPDKNGATGAWVHDANGRGQLAKDLLTRMAAIAAKPRKEPMRSKDKSKDKDKDKGRALSFTEPQTFAVSQLGVPLIRTVPLLAKTVQLGLGFGWYNLRLYFDMVPKEKASDASGNTQLGWKRWLVGWAFEAHPGLIDAAYITPHLGAWTWDAILPVSTTDPRITIASFQFDHAVSAGIELRVRETLGAFRFVPYYSFDAAYAILKQAEGSVTVTGNKAGLEIWPPILLGKSVAPYAFGFYERVSLDNHSTSTGPDDHQVYDRGVIYAELYLGLGLRLAL